MVRAWFPPSDVSQNRQVVRPEPCAISTRASPSFIRVGQVELHARTRSLAEFRQFLFFAMRRDFPDVYAKHSLKELEEMSKKNSGNDDVSFSTEQYERFFGALNDMLSTF